MTRGVNHLLNVDNLTFEDVMEYVCKASEMKNIVLEKGGDDRLKNKTLVSIFYEPSTRTCCSFQAAMLKLGGNNIVVNELCSSTKKGESLEDTIRSLNYYGDAIVVRHPLKNSSHRCANVSSVPIINAGDGNGEHPTQALLDVYTILSELGHRNFDLNGKINVTFLGDLQNSRTIHSLIKLLSLFKNVNFIYICPPGFDMPQDIVDFVASKNISQIQNMILEDAVKITDVLYVTRIQSERINPYDDDMRHNLLKNKYCVDKRIMELAKSDMIVMHPLPRNDEMSTEIDEDPRSVYFKQMQNGVYMRMAILDKLLL
jgi:aspartate carbamoyltransferase